jgi:transposase
LRGQAPLGHSQTLTFPAALRRDRIDPLCVLDGPINGESFKFYIEQFLVPTLKPGDNVHHGQSRQPQGPYGAPDHSLCRREASLLPPTLHPIEQVFAKLKTLLRKAVERTVETAWQRIGALLNCSTPQDCANYIRKARSRSSLAASAFAVSSESVISITVSLLSAPSVNGFAMNMPVLLTSVSTRPNFSRAVLNTLSAVSAAPTSPCTVTMSVSEAGLIDRDVATTRQNCRGPGKH